MIFYYNFKLSYKVHTTPTPSLHDASNEKHLQVQDVTGHSECSLK